MKKTGVLYLIPVPIVENKFESIPQGVKDIMHATSYFIVERARTSRRLIKASGFEGNMADLKFIELDKRNPEKLADDLFSPIQNGFNMGLMSEAGMPGIADPGALVVKKAHQLNIQVIPLTGPSSIFLALAASGLNGQQFAFEGYLPVKKPALIQKIKQLENRIRKERQTQIFIETPYRNESLFSTLLENVNTSISLCVAVEINSEMEFIKTLSISQWQKSKKPELHKKTCVFLLGY